MEQSAGLGFGTDGVGNGGVRASAFGPRGCESWLHAHEALVKLAKKRAGLDFEEGRLLLSARRGEAHARLGYGSFAEYVERLFGYSARQTQEKLRVAEALEALPETARELQAGNVSFSAVRELTRVVTPETEGEWLKAAREKTVREVEELVSGQRPGALPGDVPDSGAKLHLIRFEVSAEVFATFWEAMTQIRRDDGEPLDDDEALLLFARHVLGAPRPGALRDEGRSSYQIALTICEVCRRGQQQARGKFEEISPEVVAMACCDAQHIGRVDGGGGAVGSVAPHVGAELNVGTDPHVGTAHDVSQKIQRAKQSIPPAIRRLVLRRDGGRC